MLTIIGQYDKISGPDAVKQHKLTFTIDEYHSKSLKGFYDYEKGTTFLIALVLVDDALVDAKDFTSENPKELIKKFRNRMHALIKEKAADGSITPKEIKNALRKKLKSQRYLTESTKELTAEGFAAAIHMLQTDF